MQHIPLDRPCKEISLSISCTILCKKAIDWLYVKQNEAQKEGHLSLLQAGQQEAIMATLPCTTCTSYVRLGPQDVL